MMEQLSLLLEEESYYNEMSHAVNLYYGDNKACSRIVRALKGELVKHYGRSTPSLAAARRESPEDRQPNARRKASGSIGEIKVEKEERRATVSLTI